MLVQGRKTEEAKKRGSEARRGKGAKVRESEVACGRASKSSTHCILTAPTSLEPGSGQPMRPTRMPMFVCHPTGTIFT